jgi:hypothetical protein
MNEKELLNTALEKIKVNDVERNINYRRIP